MSVKVADTLKGMNSDIAVAEAIDVDIEINGTNKRLQQAYEDGDLGGGSSTQVDTMPIASVDELGKIYQYIGASGTYTNGFFYQCKAWGYWGWDCDGTTLYTKDIETIVGKNVYIDSSGTVTLEGTITQVADDYSTMTYVDTNEDIHECTRDNNEDITNQGYAWTEKEVSPSNVKVDNTSIVQDSSTHEISVAETYETTKTCIDIDEWNALSPTEQAKYENVILKQDETTTPISIVDMVQNGNMHAVTSNAVHDYVQAIKDVIPSNASSSNKLVSASDNNFKYKDFGSTSTQDANLITTTGVYSLCNNSPSTQHLPSELAQGEWVIIYATNVNNNQSCCQQILIDWHGNMWKRVMWNVTWGSWKKLAEEGDTVRWIGNAQGLTLAQIFNTYSKQNTTMYKGFLDWNDNRCPIYGQGADTVEITCYDWNLTATSIKGQDYFYDDTNNVWVKNTNISQGTLTIPAQTIQSGEYAEVQIPMVANDFYCGRLDFGNLPSVNMTISYNDFSGLFQDTKGTQNRTQDVLIVAGKPTQLVLHVYLTNYTGQPVTIGNVDVTYYLEHHIVKE